MFSWPLVCFALFVQLPTEKAAIWSLLGGYMLLPSGMSIDPALLPPMDKMAITAVSTLLCCWMKGGDPRTSRPSIVMYILGIGFVVAPIFTSFDNSYELQQAGKSVHGFYPMDGLKFAGRNVMMLIPLHIGRRYLSSENARLLLLKAIPAAMLVYSLPMLFELRMSPQLHRWVYGYFPSTFNQQMRDGGFRPVVFFVHGLALGLFTAVAFLCVLLLIRARKRVWRVDSRLIAAYLGGVVVLCKSLGPLIYSVVFAPMVLFTRPRLWVKVGCAASLIVCAYPVLRSHHLAPTQLVSDVTSSISPDRSDSFKIRVLNEGHLLAKAEQKPWFGWGGWGRNRIFDQWTGADISVTDGGWIIYFGVYGWLGYLSLYGLLAVALFKAHAATSKEMTPENVTRAGIALLLTVYVIDSVPNSTQEWLVFLLAGCVSSTPRRVRKAVERPSAAEDRKEELVLA